MVALDVYLVQRKEMLNCINMISKTLAGLTHPPAFIPPSRSGGGTKERLLVTKEGNSYASMSHAVFLPKVIPFL